MMGMARYSALALSILAFASFSRAASPVSRVTIDEIEIEGVTALSASEASSAIEVSPGDYLEKNPVVRSARNLQALYFIRGFQDMTVKSDLSRRKESDGTVVSILRFAVQEGKPTRIRRINIFPEMIRNKSVEALWPRFERGLLSKVSLKAGDPLDQDRVSEIRRNLENELAAQEFVGAKAGDVRLNVVAEPAKGEIDAKLISESQRWVDVEFHIDLGDRVTFGFRGNRTLNQNELLKLVEDQRVIGLGSDYLTTIRGKLEEQYRSMGYAHVKVITRTFEHPDRQERHVTFEIQEGARVRVESVDFDGNSVFSDEVLRAKYFEVSPYLVQRHFYVEKDAERGVQFLVEWLQSQGYLYARSIAMNRTFSGPKQSGVRLLIYVSEGEQTLVKSFDAEGITALSMDDIRVIFEQTPGKPLNLFAFSDGVEKLKSRYREMGYLDVKVANEQDESIIRYSNRNRLAELKIQVQEGVRYRFGEIRLFGLERTLPEIVRRELRFSEEDFIEKRAITESEGRLRRLGIFASSTVELKESPGRPGYKDAHVVVQEGSPGRVAGGVGMRNDLGIRVFGETSYANLWRRNHTWSLSANANRRFEDYCRNSYCFAEYQFRMAYSWPWFLIDEMTFRPELTQQKVRFKEFDASTTALSMTLERRLLKYVNLVGALTYSIEQTRQFNAKFEEDRQTLLIGGITPNIRLDLRDDPWAPTRGFFAILSHEEASSWFGSQTEPFPIAYRRSQLRTDYTLPLAPKVSWYFSFRTGIETNIVSPEKPDGSRDRRIAIPLIKQFTVGGVNSLRGFRSQELNLQNIAIQQASYVNYRTQVDLPFVGDLRFGPFLDAANLLVDRYSLGRLRYGAGFGFHYSTPVGPVNFDWGFKLDPRPGEDQNQFYFSLGII